MAEIKALYGTSNQAITITLSSLANNGARQSTVVDNSSDLFLDALVFISIASATASTSATGYVNVYAFGTSNDGTTYTEGAGATDAAITLTAPPNARLIGTINVVANSQIYEAGPFSVAAAFGGVLPAKWGIIIQNVSAAALFATEGSHVKVYQGVKAQSA